MKYMLMRVYAYKVYDPKTNAYEMHAHEVRVYETYAYQMHAVTELIDIAGVHRRCSIPPNVRPYSDDFAVQLSVYGKLLLS
jgi:hypothetical protein